MTRPYKQWKQQYDEQQHELKKHATALDKIVFKIDQKKLNLNQQPSLRQVQPSKQAKITKGLPSPKRTEPLFNLLPPEIMQRIVHTDYKAQLKYKLRDWISTILDEKLEQGKIGPYEWPKLLCANTNVTAIEILKGKCRENGPESLDWKELCKNPIAIPLIEKAYNETPNMIEYDELAGNSAAYDLLISTKEENPANFHWGNFSANSRIGTIFTDKHTEESQLSREDYYRLHDAEKLNWAKVSGNRSTYVLRHLFNSVPNLINIGSLSGNPNPMAIDFLRKRIKFEKELSADVLERLQYHEKIDWFLLSGNYAAYPLLLENKDKIIWAGLSINESAIPLIKKRIEDEEKLMKKSNDKLAERDKEIAKLKQQIENLKNNVRINEVRLLQDDLLEFTQIMIQNKIYELKDNIVELEKKIDSVPHIENNFLFEPNKLNWPSLCSNSKAIKILENEYKKNPNNIHLQYLLANPSIFVLDRGVHSNPTELPIRFRSSSGNMLLLKPGAKSAPAKTPGAKTPVAKTPGAKTPVAKTPVAKTPGAKSAPAKIPSRTPVAKKPASLKSSSSSRKSSNYMVESSLPSTPLTPRSLNASPLPVPSLSKNASNDMGSPSTPLTPRSP
jgi:hypothetical protein